MTDGNFRLESWAWGAALTLMYHGTFAQVPAPPAYNSGLRNAIAVCAAIPGIYTAFGARIKGGDLPFTYGIVPVAGAPYSAVGVTDAATTFVDGNRITRHETTRFYRDNRGRTRIDDMPPPEMATASPMPAIVLINDP